MPSPRRTPITRTRRGMPLAGSLALAISFALAAPATPAAPADGLTIPQDARIAQRLGDAEQQARNRAIIAQSQRWAADYLPSGANEPRGDALIVTNCDDDGPGSLRQIVDDVAVDGDTVDLSELTCSEITLESPLFVTQESLTLRGANRAPVINGVYAGNAGLIQHGGTGTLGIDSLTLAFGSKYQSSDSKYAGGGCVASSGDVVFQNSVAKYCQARHTGNGPATGGAIAADGNLTMKYSVVVSNDALVEGSGIARGGGVYAEGGLTMKYSTVAGNEAHNATIEAASGQGGGMQINGGAFIGRSTISGNEAANIGGLAVFGDSTIRSSTISGNTSHSTTGTVSSGSSAFLYPSAGGSVYLSNTTITNNVNETYENAGLFIGGDASVTVTAISNIVSGNSGDGASYDWFVPDATITGDHNLVGWDSGGLPPPDTIVEEYIDMLPLGDYGGATQTQPIGTGSWAFNRGIYNDQGKTDPHTDQRGENREVGAGVDIGAFETDALFIGRFEEPPRVGAPIVMLRQTRSGHGDDPDAA